jgi:NADH dehydrogenase [ubiquinone] 1 alpha subcomplex assembly factor 7
MARELIGGFARAGIELEYAAVEVSPGARAALEELTPRVARALGELEPLEPGVVVANELLDNLPFRRVRRLGDDVLEVLVGFDGDRFVDVEIPAAPELRSFARSLPAGRETTYPAGALAFVDELVAATRRGYALLVDYGSAAGPSEAAHGYRDQRLVTDVLEDPGSADLTAGVDLGAVAAHALTRGLEPLGTVDQSSALRALGYDEWTSGARSRQATLLQGGRGSEAVRTWDARSRAATLVDPSALGRLRWLLLSTPGLAPPDWLERARALDPLR